MHLAHDLRLQRKVAVKLFHPGAGESARQEAEVALTAALAHPALVRLYDGGRSRGPNGDDVMFLVMELVDGETLHAALRAGPMPCTKVASIAVDLCAALGYLHRQGIVHRDVKPANVLLPRDGDVAARLSDFGVARMVDDARLTGAGLTVGTANYLSPEQVTGQEVGPPSDVYALGLVLIEALTGATVYAGAGIPAAIARLHRSPSVPGAFGPVWGALLHDMVAADPAVRPTAEQVRQRLRNLIREQAPVAADPTSDTARTTTLDPSSVEVATALLPPMASVDATGTRRAHVARHRRAYGTVAAIGSASIAAVLVLLAEDDSAVPAEPSQPTTPAVPRPSGAVANAGSTAAAPSAAREKARHSSTAATRTTAHHHHSHTVTTGPGHTAHSPAAPAPARPGGPGAGPPGPGH